MFKRSQSIKTMISSYLTLDFIEVDSLILTEATVWANTAKLYHSKQW